MRTNSRKKKKHISKRRKTIGKIVLAIICIWLCIGLFFLLKQTIFSDEPETVPAESAAVSGESLIQDAADGQTVTDGSSEPDTEGTVGTVQEPESTAPESTTEEDMENYDKMIRLAKQVVDDSTSDSDSDLYKLYNTYWWIKNRMKYTGTSNKNGWVNEAIHGFETLSGDCYTHFAMMKAVMHVMDFETIDIKRLGGETRHFWNLVKYNGEWYHIDSCPRSEDKDKYWYCFLRTDQELLDWDKYQDAAKGYYAFDSSLYPATASEPLNLGKMQSRK